MLFPSGVCKVETAAADEASKDLEHAVTRISAVGVCRARFGRKGEARTGGLRRAKGWGRTEMFDGSGQSGERPLLSTSRCLAVSLSRSCT